jgi:poly-gamma-glutamate capsule biosynthesis protein CapA/YwtB (metallophosphatase superfamily)
MKELTWIVAALGLLFSTVQSSSQEIVVTFGGDVNFARSRENPAGDVVRKSGNHTVEELAATLRPEWATGDLNFINVETVVSEEDGMPRAGKAFVFRSHPASFEALMDLGVNAFSLANNHAHDHGFEGMEATLKFFEMADRQDRPLLFAGVGRGDAALWPRVIRVNGLTVAMAAVGFGSGAYAPRPGRAGMAYYNAHDHFDAVLANLKSIPADLKILSIHYGTENQTTLNSGQRETFRRALEEAGVNLVLGHHPHVVRGVEVEPDKARAIFYSLGNLLFIGGAGKDDKRLGKDYGLLGKAYFSRTNTGLVMTAIEAIPLKGVHLRPVRMSAAHTAGTLDHLNALSKQTAGEMGARFELSGTDTDRGAMCFSGPYGPRAQALCCAIRHEASCDFPDLM